jgi:hypothetical protein
MIKHYDLLVQHAFFLFGAGLVTASCQGAEMKANGVNSTLILTGVVIYGSHVFQAHFLPKPCSKINLQKISYPQGLSQVRSFC